MENSIQKPQGSQSAEQKERNEKAIEAGTKAMAIFGLIVLLGLISIGIIKIAPPIIRGIATGMSTAVSTPAAAPSFAVSASQSTVESGQAFVLSWASPDNEAGSYTISYPCTSQFYLEATGQPASGQTSSAEQASTANVAASGNSIVYCNSNFQFLNTSNSIVLAGYVQTAPNSNSSANANTYQPVAEPITVPITVHFVQNGALQNGIAAKDTAVATANITFLPQQYQAQTTPAVQTAPAAQAAARPAVSKPAASSLTAGQKTQSIYPIQVQQSLDYTPNTNADLTVQILATGIIDPNTNAFVPENSVNPSNRGAIQFEISNTGGHPTGSWSFSAILPTYPSYNFMSNAQPSLNPGDKILYTIAFNQILDQPQDTFTINADNTGEVTETNKTNNIVHGILFVHDPSLGN